MKLKVDFKHQQKTDKPAKSSLKNPSIDSTADCGGGESDETDKKVARGQIEDENEHNRV